MHQWPRKINIWRKPRYLPLQYRLILLSSGLVMLLLVIAAFAVSDQQSKTIRNQAERRGLAIAHSLAATSKSALTTYNYISLSQTANQAAQDPDLAYVIIHDKEGRIAGYSGRIDLEGKFLHDELTQRAISSSEPLIQKVLAGEPQTPILDVAVPVTIPGSDRAWGVVRVALSLEPMYRQIRQVQLTIAMVGVLALLLSVMVCIWLARRITNPIGLLVDATIVAARGNLNHDISISTGDEVEVLADNFSAMIHEILLQREQLEQQLLEITALQQYMNRLLTTMSDGLLSMDMGGKLVTVNPAACVILGTDASAFEQGLSVRDFLKEAPELLEYIQEALQLPYSPRQRELRVARDRETKNISVASSVLTGKSGAPQQLIVNLHNVTELKKLEARVRQTERLAALGTLSAGMAHEIRNPLSAIKTFVQLLPRKLEKPGFLEKFQRTVPRELERINRLIEDLLELAREPKYQFSSVGVGLLLEQAMELFEEDLLLHNIDCRCDIPGELPAIWANADQLAKAINNILRNAIQAMPAGGNLHVHAFAGPPPGGVGPSAELSQSNCSSCLTLVFSDSGVGMESEDMKSVFNPFFTTKDTGTGLGLAITHKVVTEHGGQIEVDSAPGKGTRFTICLPVREVCPAHRLPSSARA